MVQRIFRGGWIRFWMFFAGLGIFGRLATRLAEWAAPPFKARRYLARLNARGYVSTRAMVPRSQLHSGANIFIGDRVVIFRHAGAGDVTLGDRVHLHCDTIVETGDGGSVTIGADTHIQPRCQLNAFLAPIEIGARVQIAPNCCFYSYDHSFAPGTPIQEQPLQTKGGIRVGEDAWLGVGVTVLDGVTIGEGAVVAAGSVVLRDIPPGAIAVGTPARVVRMRADSA